MGWWGQLFRQRAEDWVFSPLKADQVPEEPLTNDEVLSDDAYLIMTLRSMRIVNVRQMATKFYGVVHSFSTLQHLAGPDAAFHMVTTPAQLRSVDSKNLDRVITVNQPILGPIPYRGGLVGLELGLFSVKEADLAAPFINVLESLASQASIAIVSAALPFIEPLKKGIDAITGTEDAAILEIGVSTNFAPPRTGWYIVMRARKQDVEVSKLRVTPGDFRLVDTQTKALVQNYPYMVFTVTQTKQRPDWYKLPDLTRPYRDLQAAVRQDELKGVEACLAAFQRYARTSDDLIPDDAERIAKLVQERTERVMEGTVTAQGGVQNELPALESYPLYASTPSAVS